MPEDVIGTAEAKETIRELLLKLEPEQIGEVKEWFDGYVNGDDNTDNDGDQRCLKHEQKRKRLLEQRAKKLDKIAEYLKEQGIATPSKEPNTLSWPTYGFDSDCTQANTCEIDSFLYEDPEVDELVDRGVLSRTYCPKCNSRDTVSLNFISHSLSRLQVKFIFDQLMPKDTQHVLDIGSRIGAIVYGASLFTNGNVKTVGVEMDKEFAELSLRTIRQFGLKNIEIVQDDIRHLPHVFKPSQLVTMNNVFSFFLSKSEQEACWEFLHEHMLPGTVLVHHPPIEKVTEHLELSFEIGEWLEEVDTASECVEYGGEDPEVFEEMESIGKYRVKAKAQ